VQTVLESKQQGTSLTDQVAVYRIIVIPLSQINIQYLSSLLSILSKDILRSSKPILFESLRDNTRERCLSITVWCVDSKQESWDISVSERRHLTLSEGV